MASGTIFSITLHSNGESQLILPDEETHSDFNVIKACLGEQLEVSKRNGKKEILGEIIKEINNEDFSYYFIDVNDRTSEYKIKK